MRCVASCAILLNTNNLHNMPSLAVTVARSLLSMKRGKIMPPLYKPHQTVILNGCIDFCKNTCGFSESQISRFSLLTCPPRSKRASFEKIFLRYLCAISHWPIYSNKSQRCSRVNRFITFSDVLSPEFCDTIE